MQSAWTKKAQESEKITLQADLDRRNKELITSIKAHLSEEKYKEFRQLSVQFRNSEITDTEYYNIFLETFGEKGDSFFDQLVALLPDEEKRLQLQRIAQKEKEMRAQRAQSRVREAEREKERLRQLEEVRKRLADQDVAAAEADGPPSLRSSRGSQNSDNLGADFSYLKDKDQQRQQQRQRTPKAVARTKPVYQQKASSDSGKGAKAAAAAAPNAAASAAVEPEAPPEEPACFICTEPLPPQVPVGRCNHRNVCLVCMLRNQMLYKEDQCPFCKTSLERLVLSVDHQKPFDAYDLSALQFDQETKVHYEESCLPYLQSVKQLWDMKCPVPSCPDKAKDQKTISQLKKHLKSQHSFVYCSICLEHRKVFTQEQLTYTASGLQQHLRSGDKETAIKHEECSFCDKLFFDKDAIYDHLQKQHERCHLCEADGRLYQYYRDYKDLEKHFDQEHYLCHEPECLQKTFVVFRTEMDLKFHDVQVHMHRRGLSKQEEKSARQLQLFTVRGYMDESAERDGGGGGRGGRRGGGRGGGRPGRGGRDRRDGRDAELPDGRDVPPPSADQPPPPSSAEDFPMLDGASAAPAAVAGRSWVRPEPARRPEDFPALPAQPRPQRASASGSAASRATGAGGVSNDFPGLPARTPSPVVPQGVWGGGGAAAVADSKPALKTVRKGKKQVLYHVG